MALDYGVDIRELVDLATPAAAVIGERFDALCTDPDLEDVLLEPIQSRARELFGNWACLVLAKECHGINLDGTTDKITDTAGIFTGTLNPAAVGLQSVETDPEDFFFGGSETRLTPALIFDTQDERSFDGPFAQSYLQLAVPLVGNIVTARRVVLTEADGWA